MIVRRYEKADKYLDLERFSQKSLDEDGLPIYDESWECTIYSKKDTPSSGEFVEFASESMAMMFITQNNWTLTVL